MASMGSDFEMTRQERCGDDTRTDETQPTFGQADFIAQPRHGSSGSRIGVALLAGSVTIVFLALGSPASAAASRPSVGTDGASPTSATSGTVDGNADPEGQRTTVRAYYALASERWCANDGAKGKMAKTTAEKLGSGYVEYSEVLVKLSGLVPASEYCVELVATNKSGKAYGGQVRFSTPASPPEITTDGAYATSATTATVEGNGDPEGQSTAVHADYALASERWCTSDGTEGSPAETLPKGLGSGEEMFSEILVTLEGLAPASEYCTALVATSHAGTTYGGQRAFTTPTQP
jgi:hypothetical protein